MTISERQLSEFRTNSVLHIKNLIDPSLCLQCKNFFLENEEQIIRSYGDSPKGLVVEEVDGSKYVKYFEYPLHYSSKFFGAFLSSEIYSLGQLIIGKPVRFVSAEIHSRHSGASEIPPHQDNAYYGLTNGDAITFYISLDPQTSCSGGLQYISNPNHQEYPHIPSSSAAFSLALADLQLVSGRQIIRPIYSPGDCTIHHSRSIHFADCTPHDSNRAIVFRITLYSTLDIVKSNHAEWYSEMISSNRALRS